MGRSHKNIEVCESVSLPMVKFERHNRVPIKCPYFVQFIIFYPYCEKFNSEFFFSPTPLLLLPITAY